MKVGLVVPEYRTPQSGGGGVASVADFVLAALDPTWDVTVVSPRMSRKAAESRRLLQPRTWLRRLTVRPRDGVHYVGAHLAESEIVRLMPRKALDRALSDVDVVVVVAGSPAMAGLVSRLHKPTLLQVATFVDVERVRAIAVSSGLRKVHMIATTRIVSAMDRVALRKPDIVLVENEWMRDRCLSFGAKRVELCPPGVDTDAFRPPSHPASDGYLVSVSRLGDPRKDLGTLVRAYAYARSMGVTRPLVLAGRGQLPSEVARLIQELGLAGTIEVRRDLSPGELVDTLQRASLFVMSSAEEGLGLTMVEAMACGLPVVTTANEGARMVIGETAAGELVPIGDAEALGRSIVDWEGRGDVTTNREAARTRAEQEFSKRTSGARFKYFIQELANNQIGAR